jgi:hypothetical protein
MIVRLLPLLALLLVSACGGTQLLNSVAMNPGQDRARHCLWNAAASKTGRVLAQKYD